MLQSIRKEVICQLSMRRPENQFWAGVGAMLDLQSKEELTPKIKGMGESHLEAMLWARCQKSHVTVKSLSD